MTASVRAAQDSPRVGDSVAHHDAHPAPTPWSIDRPRYSSRLPHHLMLLSRLSAVAALAIGAIVLLGYAVHNETVVELYPTLPPMYPNAALGFVIAGLSTLAATHASLRRQRLGATGFAVVGAYGAVTLVLHAVDAPRTVLEVLFPRDGFVAATTPVGGRPVAETCIAFVLVGVAGAALALRRSARISQALALGTVTVGAAATLGFAIGVDRRSLGTSFVSVGMALHTAVALTFVGLGVLLAQPTVGLFGRLTHTGPSARLGRRLVLVVVVAPIVLTAATSLLEQAMPDARLALSFAAVLQVLALALLVMLPLSAAEGVELAANDALQEARRLGEEAGERDTILAALATQLSSAPHAPDGWDLAFRQAIAFGSLPGDSCQLLHRVDADGRRHMLIALVDLAGHGTEPALVALGVRAEIGALWNAGHTLTSISDAVNRAVEGAATIGSGILVDVELDTGECTYLNAGHPSALVGSPGSVSRWGTTQPIFGYSGGRAQVHRSHLHRGDFLLLYTDGVTEARRAGRPLLGEHGVETALRQPGLMTVDIVADACMDAALAHAGGRLPDDAIALVLRRR